MIDIEKKLKELENRIKNIEDGNIRHLKQIAEVIQEEMKEEILEAVNLFVREYIDKKKITTKRETKKSDK